MPTILERLRISAELRALEDLRAGLSENDILGSIGVDGRIQDLKRQLEEADSLPATKAEIALVFDGRPVHGASAIQASFGTRALDTFQRAISTSFALQASEGQIGQRGPAPSADLSALHITGVTHGSFGFVLEELDPNGRQWVDSALKTASETVVALIESIAAEDDALAGAALDEVNDRLFSNIRELIKLIQENDATLQLALPDRVADLSAAPLRRAYERIGNATLEDEEIVLHGILEGLLPSARRFEFRSKGELIRGKVARSISDEYLESLQSTPLVGQGVTATFKRRTVRDYAAAPRESYHLVKLVPDVGMPSHAI